MDAPEIYIAKEKAAKYLGLSVRRTQDYAARGLIRRRLVRDPKTRRQVSVMSQADIERLKITLEGGVETLPEALQTAAPRELAPVRQTLALPAAAVPPLTRWLDLRQAAEYLGLPIRHLKEAIETGELAARDIGVTRPGRWRIRREELDALSGHRIGA